MAGSIDNDPILEAYQLWIDNGWEDSADGLAAVTSIMRVNQVLAKRADAAASRQLSRDRRDAHGPLLPGSRPPGGTQQILPYLA